MIYFLISIFLIFLDQISKFFAANYLQNLEPLHLIGNFFDLEYVENRGAAFGILQNKQIFFYLITIAVSFFLIYSLFKSKNKPGVLKSSLAFLLGGALGNFIDRVRLNYVVDFLSLNFFGYHFPVFNFADLFITIGTILLIIYILWFEKNENN